MVRKKNKMKTNFTAKELMDILIDYTVYHVPYLPGTAPMYTCFGVTDSEDRNIVLADNHTLVDRRKAGIHEFLHAYHDRRGEKVPHVQINREEKIIYRKIYGKD